MFEEFRGLLLQITRLSGNYSQTFFDKFKSKMGKARHDMIKRLPTTIHKYKLDRWPFAIMASITTRFHKEYLIDFFPKSKIFRALIYKPSVNKS